MTLRHCRHRQDDRGTNFRPRWRDRQQLIEQLTREIMNYDAEYRREDAAGGIGVSRTALDLCGVRAIESLQQAEQRVWRLAARVATAEGPV